PFLLSPLDRLLHVVVAVDESEIEDRRGAAEESGLADPVRTVGQVGLGLARRRHRPAAMDMRVDAARDNDLPGRVNRAAGTERREAAGRADRHDLVALDTDIDLLRAG